MPTRISSAANTIQHDNYSTSTVAVTKTPTQPANFIFIKNTDGTDSVLVSFDAGTTYFTIGPNGSLSLDCDKLVSYKVKSSANTPAVQALYGYES